MSAQTGIMRLFLKDSSGKVVCRRTEIWSSKAPECRACKRTDRPHEARGLCHLCYVKWRHANNVGGCGDRARARQKAFRLTDEGDRRAREHEAARLADPKQRRLIHAAKLRYAKRQGKFKAGTAVEWCGIAGHPLRGVVIENGQGTALVQFMTFKQRIPQKHLRRVEVPA